MSATKPFKQKFLKFTKWTLEGKYKYLASVNLFQIKVSKSIFHKLLTN